MASPFVKLLTTLRSGDNAARSAAEKEYTTALQQNPNSALHALAECLNPAVHDEVLRQQAATLLRRATVQTGPTETAWSRSGALVQAEIRTGLFKVLEAEHSAQVRKIICACIAAIAGQTTEQAPWAELVPSVLTLGKSTNTVHQDAALRLFAELMTTSYAKAIFAQRQEVGGLLVAGLGQQALQGAALSLICEMVSVLDAESCQELQPAVLLPMVEQALKALAVSDISAFEEALQSLVACATDQAAFFKPRYGEWVELMLELAGAKGSVEDKNRSLAFEWVSTVAETKSKALLKVRPDLPQKVLAMAFMFLADVEEDDDWTEIDEDEEEDDDDGLHKAGEAKVDFFVKKLGFKQTGKSLMALLLQYGTSHRWEDKFAACMAIRASVEFVDNSTELDNMTTLLLKLAQDPHMRVRYAALHALGQTCHDQDVEFHNRWHSRLLPLLTQCSGDPVGRVSAMATGALEAVIADLDEEVLETYAKPILEVFVKMLTTSSHKGVLVSVMEALGALAAGLEGSFDAYYDQLMNMLLAFVSKPTADASAAKLRGKAFECISLLGYSVGKERFAIAAKQTMSAMLATPQVSDDMQTDCIRDAMERMCQIMGTDFAPFLPDLLPGILSSMSMDSAVSAAADDEEDANNADELLLPTESGLMKVNTRQIQEILAIVSLLTVFIKETGPTFLEYVQPTAEALNKILMSTDAVMSCASQVRDSVYPCWAELVKVVTHAIPTKGQQAQVLVVELVQRFVDKVAADLIKEEEPSESAAMSNGIASVVSNAGVGCIQPAQVTAMCKLAVSEILKSFQREKALKDGNPNMPFGGKAEEDDDTDDEEVVGDVLGKDEEEEELDCRKGLCAIFGACLKANPEVFVSHSWPTLEMMMKEWLAPQAGVGPRLLALNVACDLCEHLSERAVAIWPVFMEQVLESVGSDNTDTRGTAAFCIVLASQVDSFGPQYAARAYIAVGQALQKFKVKKNDDDGQRAGDNLVAALVQLCLSHPGQSPDLDQCWQVSFAKLPLKKDVEEGQKLHRKLFNEAQKPNGGNLGSMARVAQVLGYLCDQYGRSEHCDEDLQNDIAKAFANLPQATLESLVSQFSSKQQQKIQKILQDGRQ